MGWHGDALRLSQDSVKGTGDPSPSCFPTVAFALQEAAGGVVSCDVGTTLKVHGYRAGCMAERTTHFFPSSDS